MVGNNYFNNYRHLLPSNAYSLWNIFSNMGWNRKDDYMDELTLLDLKVKAQDLRNMIKKLKDDLKSYDRQIAKAEQ